VLSWPTTRQTGEMEPEHPVVVRCRPSWATEADDLIALLQGELGDLAVRIDKPLLEALGLELSPIEADHVPALAWTIPPSGQSAGLERPRIIGTASRSVLVPGDALRRADMGIGGS
jgi:hypothetical protein